MHAITQRELMAQDITGANKEFSLPQRATRRFSTLSNVLYRLKKQPPPLYEPSYHEVLTWSVSAARGEGTVSPDVLDGYRSFEVICAAEESAQTGRSVSLVPSVMDS